MPKKICILGSCVLVASAMHCSQVAPNSAALPVAEVAEAVIVRNRGLSVDVDKKSDASKSVQPTIWSKHTRKKSVFVFNATATVTQPTEKKENENQASKQEATVKKAKS